MHYNSLEFNSGTFLYYLLCIIKILITFKFKINLNISLYDNFFSVNKF